MLEERKREKVTEFPFNTGLRTTTSAFTIPGSNKRRTSSAPSVNVSKPARTRTSTPFHVRPLPPPSASSVQDATRQRYVISFILLLQCLKVTLQVLSLRYPATHALTRPGTRLVQFARYSTPAETQQVRPSQIRHPSSSYVFTSPGRSAFRMAKGSSGNR